MLFLGLDCSMALAAIEDDGELVVLVETPPTGWWRESSEAIAPASPTARADAPGQDQTPHPLVGP